MEDAMLINLFWFLGGALIYKFSSYIFGVGVSINLFAHTMVNSLVMLKKVDEQMLLMIKRQRSLSKKEGLAEKQINDAEEISLQAHEFWRVMVVKTIISCCPKKIRNTLKFKDWTTAMQLLEK